MEKKFYFVGEVSEYNQVWLYSKTEDSHFYFDVGQQVFHLTEDQAKDSQKKGKRVCSTDKLYEVTFKEIL